MVCVIPFLIPCLSSQHEKEPVLVFNHLSHNQTRAVGVRATPRQNSVRISAYSILYVGLGRLLPTYGLLVGKVAGKKWLLGDPDTGF